VQDLIELHFLNAPSILHNLKTRFEAAAPQVYTATGPILIAVNPFRPLPALYARERMEACASGDACARGAPHIFRLADGAYRALLREGRGQANPCNPTPLPGIGGVAPAARGAQSLPTTAARRGQAVLVSGESGSGKTETTKYVMSYLAFASTLRAGAGDGAGAGAEEKVLSSNPLLESFGNAMTLRNDNSSRFGKFVNLRFSRGGRLVGGAVETYLIETSRVVFQVCCWPTASPSEAGPRPSLLRRARGLS